MRYVSQTKKTHEMNEYAALMRSSTVPSTEFDAYAVSRWRNGASCLFGTRSTSTR